MELYFVRRIGLLVLSDFALIFPGLPNNCFVVFLVALHVPFKPNWSECVWKQVSQQKPRVVISGPDQTHFLLQRWSEECGHCLTKCPSTALRAEPWTPVGWLRMRRGGKRLNDCFLSFLLSCAKWSFQRRYCEGSLFENCLLWDTMYKEDNSCDWMHWLLYVYTGSSIFCSAHNKKTYVHYVISRFFASWVFFL